MALAIVSRSGMSIRRGFSQARRASRRASINGSIPTARWKLCKVLRQQRRRSAALLQSPLPGSKPETPSLYEEGPCVNWLWSFSARVKAGVVVGGERCSSLYRLLIRGQGRWEFAPVAHLLKDRRAATGSV